MGTMKEYCVRITETRYEYIEAQNEKKALAQAEEMVITKADKVECKIVDEAENGDSSGVKHGKWISASNKPGVNAGMKCSLCAARIKYSEFYNGNHKFFHKCGAIMDGRITASDLIG